MCSVPRLHGVLRTHWVQDIMEDFQQFLKLSFREHFPTYMTR